MNHTAARILVVVAVLLLPAEAFAQLTPMGSKTSIVIDMVSGFRVSAFGGNGFSYAGPIGVVNQRSSERVFNANVDNVYRTTTFWLSPSADFFFFPFALSLGALFEISSTSGSQDVVRGNTNTTVTQDLATTTSVTFLPRVGYLIAIGDKFGIWPRGALGYGSRQTLDPNDPNVKFTTSGFLTEVDVGFLWRPLENVFFRLGPDMTFSLGASHSAVNRGVSQSADASVFQIGLLGGIGGMFFL
jgi:hypothetical protein